jgi:hypothetical protein
MTDVMHDCQRVRTHIVPPSEEIKHNRIINRSTHEELVRQRWPARERDTHHRLDVENCARS